MHRDGQAAQQRQELATDVCRQRRDRAIAQTEREVVQPHDSTAAAPLQRVSLQQSSSRSGDTGRSGQVLAFEQLTGKVVAGPADELDQSHFTDDAESTRGHTKSDRTATSARAEEQSARAASCGRAVCGCPAIASSDAQAAAIYCERPQRASTSRLAWRDGLASSDSSPESTVDFSGLSASVRGECLADVRRLR